MRHQAVALRSAASRAPSTPAVTGRMVPVAVGVRPAVVAPVSSGGDGRRRVITRFQPDAQSSPEDRRTARAIKPGTSACGAGEG